LPAASSGGCRRPEPSEKISVEVHDDAAVPDVAAIEPPQPVDEAGAALRQQLEHLRASEDLQRGHAQMSAQRQQPMTRVQYLQSQGLTLAESQFFDSREDMMANQVQAREAAAEALAAGIEWDSPQFFEAVERGFAKRIDALNQRAAEPAPTPTFFQAPEPTRAPAAPDSASIYSAPVSRQAPSAGYREPSPRSVRLTSEEAAMAAASGISETEYARQKLRLLKAKASGELQ
jgi:hypothetical protein